MPRRRRRWILRLFLGLVGLLLVVVALALLVLAHLDAGPVKSFVRARARGQGIGLDYDEARVTWGGARLRGVRLLSPAPDATLAPNLVSIGSIDARWSPLAKRVDDLVIKDVAITIVVDPDGTTSLDRLIAGLPPSPPPAPQPLSSLGGRLVPPGVTARARLENVTVTLLPRAGQPVRLDGLDAAAELGAGELALHLPARELHLTIGERAAVAQIGGDVKVDARGVRLALALDLVKQDLAPALPPVQKLVDVAAQVDFVPAERRTHVRLERAALLDGALRIDADADLYDADGAPGAVRPVVHAATCFVDAVAVARALPPDFGVVALEAEPIHCRVKDLALEPAPRGELALDANIARLVMPGLTVTGVNADMTASAAHGWPVALKGTVRVGAVTVPGQRIAGVKVALDGMVQGPRALDLKAIADVDRVDTETATVAGAHVEADLAKLTLATEPLDSTGTVTLRGHVAELATPGARLGGVVFSADVHLAGVAPASANLHLDADRVATPDLPPGPAHLDVNATKIEIDRAAPAHSRAEARIAGEFGGGSIAGSVAGSAADLGWDLKLQAERIGPARAVKVASTGRYGAEITQDSTIELGRVATASATLRGAHVHVTSSGTLRRQQAKVRAALDGVVVRGEAVGSPKLDLDGSVDLDGPKLELRLAGTGPDAKLHLVAAVDRNRTLRWDVDGRFGGLGALAALLPPGPDWTQLAVEVRGSGALAGVVRGVRDGVPVLAPNFATAARGQGRLELRAHGVHVRGANETSTDVDDATAKVVADLGATRHLTVDIDVPALAAVASGVHVALEQLGAHLDATQGRGGTGHVQLTARVGGLGQSAFPSYPVRDADLTVDIEGDPKAVANLKVTFRNPAAGTSFELAGQLDQRSAPGADTVPGRRSLTLEGTIAQSLDALTGAPDLLRARGHVSVPFRVESGDLSLFRASATVKLDGVTVELPRQQIVISGAHGELPIVQEIVYGPNGVEPVGHGERGLYPQLRFADHQPFLATADYLAITEVRVGTRRFGPIAGNFRLDRDVLALDQLELSALGGKIAGQCLVALDGADTSVAFRGKITGVRPSEGPDVLDANAALTLTPYRLGLEGRVEIVRIGKQHLLDLLDVYDPYHAEVAANRVRLGLKFGYPKQVRLSFLHGFAGLAVELGGLAGIVRIDEIQGIPIGPALARYLAPVLEARK